MSSYILSSAVAIAKKKKKNIRKKNSRVSICIFSKFKNSLVYIASSKRAKVYIGTSLKIKKKLLMWRMHPLSKWKHLVVVNKMDLYLCYKAHFYLDRKVLCGNIKLYTQFSFYVGCLHAGQRTRISLGPPVQTHVLPTQSRMFPEVLQLQAVIM